MSAVGYTVWGESRAIVVRQRTKSLWSQALHLVLFRFLPSCRVDDRHDQGEDHALCGYCRRDRRGNISQHLLAAEEDSERHSEEESGPDQKIDQPAPTKSAACHPTGFCSAVESQCATKRHTALSQRGNSWRRNARGLHTRHAAYSSRAHDAIRRARGGGGHLLMQ